MIVLRSFLLTTILFIACWFTLPTTVVAGGHNHGDTNGIDILLATGMVAKLLQRRRNGFGARSNQVPIGGRAREGHYGAQSVRIVVPHNFHPPPPPPPPPPMPYQQSQPIVTYSQATHVMPQQVPHQQMSQQTISHAPTFQSGNSGSGYPSTNSQKTTIYGYFTELQPKDKVEVFRM